MRVCNDECDYDEYYQVALAISRASRTKKQKTAKILGLTRFA